MMKNIITIYIFTSFLSFYNSTYATEMNISELLDKTLATTNAYINNLGSNTCSLKIKPTIIRMKQSIDIKNNIEQDAKQLYVYLTIRNQFEKNAERVIWNNLYSPEYIGGITNKRITGDICFGNNGDYCDVLIIENDNMCVYRINLNDRMPVISDSFPPDGYTYKSWGDYIKSKSLITKHNDSLTIKDNYFFVLDQLGFTGVFLPDESSKNSISVLLSSWDGNRFLKLVSIQKSNDWIYHYETIDKSKIKEHDRQRIAERIKNTVINLPINVNESPKALNDEYVKSEIIKKFEDQKPDQIEIFVKNQSDEILKHFIQNSGPKHLSEAKLYFLLLTLSRSSSLEKQSPKLLFDFYDTSIVLVKDDFQKNRPKPGSKDQALIIIDEGLRCDAATYINQIAALKMIRKCVRRMPKGPERDGLQKRVAENAKKLLGQWQNHFLVRHLEDLSEIRPDPEENPKPPEKK